MAKFLRALAPCFFPKTAEEKLDNIDHHHNHPHHGHHDKVLPLPVGNQSSHHRLPHVWSEQTDMHAHLHSDHLGSKSEPRITGHALEDSTRTGDSSEDSLIYDFHKGKEHLVLAHVLTPAHPHGANGSPVVSSLKGGSPTHHGHGHSKLTEKRSTVTLESSLSPTPTARFSTLGHHVAFERDSESDAPHSARRGRLRTDSTSSVRALRPMPIPVIDDPEPSEPTFFVKSPKAVDKHQAQVSPLTGSKISRQSTGVSGGPLALYLNPENAHLLGQLGDPISHFATASTSSDSGASGGNPPTVTKGCSGNNIYPARSLNSHVHARHHPASPDITHSKPTWNHLDEVIHSQESLSPRNASLSPKKIPHRGHDGKGSSNNVEKTGSSVAKSLHSRVTPPPSHQWFKIEEVDQAISLQAPLFVHQDAREHALVVALGLCPQMDHTDSETEA